MRPKRLAIVAGRRALVALAMDMDMAMFALTKQSLVRADVEQADGSYKLPTLFQGSSPSPTPTVGDFPSAIAGLRDRSKPWILGVVGDSTRNGHDRWVYRAAAALSNAHDRPVVIHDWSQTSNKYEGETTVGTGTERPIVIWNGSASGMSARYSFQHRTTLIPERPDLVIVNHRHNQISAEDAMTAVATLVNWTESAWSTGAAGAVTLQNPRADGNSDRHQQVINALPKSMGRWC